MEDFYNSTLKDYISNYIKSNTNRGITGNGLKDRLLEIVKALDLGGIFLGFATTSTNPNIDQSSQVNGFYFSTQAGTYTNFKDSNNDSLVIGEGLEIIYREVVNNNLVWNHRSIATNVDISGKADKVSGATPGNFAGLDSNGNLTDSGIASSNIVQKSNTAGLLKNDGTVDTNTYLTSSDIASKADKVNNATSGNFAGLDGNGNLTNSGYDAADFVPTPSTSGTEGQILVNDGEGGMIWENKPQDGAPGDSAYDIWLNEGNSGTEQDFLNSLRAGVSEYITESYDNTAYTSLNNGNAPVIGNSLTTRMSIGNTSPNSTTLNKIILMPNLASNPTAMMMFITNEDATGGSGNETYNFVYSGNIGASDIAFHSGQFVNQVDIVNDFTTGGSGNVLSAEVAKSIIPAVEITYSDVKEETYIDIVEGVPTEQSNSYLNYWKYPVEAGSLIVVMGKNGGSNPTMQFNLFFYKLSGNIETFVEKVEGKTAINAVSTVFAMVKSNGYVLVNSHKNFTPIVRKIENFVIDDAVNENSINAVSNAAITKYVDAFGMDLQPSTSVSSANLIMGNDLQPTAATSWRYATFTVAEGQLVSILTKVGISGTKSNRTIVFGKNGTAVATFEIGDSIENSSKGVVLLKVPDADTMYVNFSYSSTSFPSPVVKVINANNFIGEEPAGNYLTEDDIDNSFAGGNDKVAGADEVKTLKKETSVRKIGFEKGALNSSTGASASNPNEVRTFYMYVGTGTGTYTIFFDIPSTINTKSNCVGYNGETYVKSIFSNTAIDFQNGTITITKDGTFDTVRISLKKVIDGIDTNVTDEELAQCFILVPMNEDYEEFKEDYEEFKESALTGDDIVNSFSGGTDKVASAETVKTLKNILQDPGEITVSFEDYFTTFGCISTSSGLVSSTTVNGIYYTDFIKIIGNKDGKVVFNAKYNFQSALGMAFYSAPNEESFIELPSLGNAKGIDGDKEVAIPSGAKYFRACGKSGAYVKYMSVGGVLFERIFDLENNAIYSAGSPLSDNPLRAIKETPGLTAILHTMASIGGSTSSGTIVNTGNSNLYEYSWISCIGRSCAAIIDNFGVGGMSAYAWLRNSSIGALSDKWANSSAMQAYFIQLGPNDNAVATNPSNPSYDPDYTCGDIDDVNPGQEFNAPNTFYGNISRIIAIIKAKDPRCKIFLVNFPYGYGYREPSTFPYKEIVRDIPSKYSYVFGIDVDTYGLPNSWFQNLGWEGNHPLASAYQIFAYQLMTYVDWIIKNNGKKFCDAALVGTVYDLNGNLLSADGGGSLACYQVSGSITSNSTPIENAEITFVGTNPQKDYYANEFYCTSDSSGNYSIGHMPTDTYTMRVHKEGYTDYQDELVTITNADVTKNVTLSVAPEL